MNTHAFAIKSSTKMKSNRNWYILSYIHNFFYSLKLGVDINWLGKAEE